MDEIEKLYRVYKNVISMLECRGYNGVYNYKIDNIKTFKENFYSSKIDILLNDNNRNILVKFILLSKIKPNQLKDIIGKAKTESLPNDDDKLILIIKPKPLCNITKIIKEREYKFVEIFWFDILMFNIMDHKLVPKQTKVGEAEKKMIIEKYNIINKQQFPIMLRTDPVARFLDLCPGDICKVERNSPTCGNYTSYRIVK